MNDFSTPDPVALNLTKAIGYQEGGGKFNYNAVGDAGTSRGAFQWQPGNFESDAKQFGLDPTDFSPKNQNKVAYSKVKAMLDSGKKPWEVAASWNAGEGSLQNDRWKTNVGDTTINGQKIHYDTPSYVNNVKSYYNKFAGGQPDQATPPEGDSSTQFQAPEGVIGDIQKGIVGTSAGRFGAGIAGELLKGGLDIGQAFLHASNLVGKLTTGANYDENIKQLQDWKDKITSQEGNIAKSGAVSEKAGEVTGEVAPLVEGIVSKGVGSLFTKPDEAEAIAKNIMPKATVKEARVAMKEGRLVAGKEPGLLTSGTPGEILPSSKVVKASQTISKQIPGAAKMDDPTLFKALDENIGKIAQKLRPELETAKLAEGDIENLNATVNKVQASQLEAADASAEKDLTKRHDLFKKRISSITPESSLADVWDARIDYDSSIPTNVKQANSLSPETLQNKKAEWLENRSIFNDLLHSKEESIAAESRQAFSDMSDMYTAQNGLLSDAKATITQTAKPSKLMQFYSKFKAPINTAIAGGSIYEVGKKVLGK